MERFFCHFLSFREERADGEQTGAKAARRSCSGSFSEAGECGVWHVVCAGMLFYVRLHQTTSDVPVDWSCRRSVSQLFSNSDSSPKVYFKMPEFLLLSFSKRASAASLLSTIKNNNTNKNNQACIIHRIFKQFLSLMSLWSVDSRTTLFLNLSLLPSLSLTDGCPSPLLFILKRELPGREIARICKLCALSFCSSWDEA